MSAPARSDPHVLSADYEALRTGSGAVRLARDVLELRGPDAQSYLQGQLSQDVTALELGGSVDSLLLAPDGKIVALLRVSRTSDETYLVDCDAGHGEAVVARLARFKLRSKFEMDLSQWQCVALRGAGLGEALHEALAAADGVVLAATTSFNGWGGVDLLGPDPTIELAGLRWCGEPAWEACRIESGLPSMDHELGDGRTIPAEAGLVESTVSFTKGCYTGQELVARLDSRGSRVARRLCGVVVSPDPGAAGSADPGTPAWAELRELLGAPLVTGAPTSDDPQDKPQKEVGTLTSVAWSPGLEAIVGLAYVHRSVEIGATVSLGAARADRGGPRLAEVRALPLR
jgi:tRNA-modifying protein YgfZ